MGEVFDTEQAKADALDILTQCVDGPKAVRMFGDKAEQFLKKAAQRTETPIDDVVISALAPSLKAVMIEEATDFWNKLTAPQAEA